MAKQKRSSSFRVRDPWSCFQESQEAKDQHEKFSKGDIQRSNGHTEKYRALLMARESELGHSQLPPHSSQNGGYQKDIRYQVVTRKWKERDPLPPHCWGGA